MLTRCHAILAAGEVTRSTLITTLIRIFPTLRLLACTCSPRRSIFPTGDALDAHSNLPYPRA